jgi:uncharacterized protein
VIKLVEQSEPKRGGRCPICRKSTDPENRPFCSRRCADLDLSRWLGGGYAIAGSVDSDEDGDDASTRRDQFKARQDATDEDE